MMAAASDATKNSIGWGSPSSDMNARDCERSMLEVDGGARRPPGEVGGATTIGQSFRASRNSAKARTSVGLRVVGASKLDIDKVHLELLLGLDTDEERRAATRSHDLVGVVRGLEDESK